MQVIYIGSPEGCKKVWLLESLKHKTIKPVDCMLDINDISEFRLSMVDLLQARIKITT